jgi:CubicO group peptidase (beta-lactamase class C family)
MNQYPTIVVVGISLLLAGALQAQPYFPTTDAAWATTTPVAAGADAALLAEAVAYAQQARSDTLVILHGGRILSENYWNGASRSTKSKLYSASKVFVAALVGRLIEVGEFASLDQKSATFLPEWQNVAGKQDITLRHHLTMTTGLEGGEQNLFLGAIARSERFFAVNLPLEHAPGTYWTYNNPAYRLLFSIVESATGETLNNVFADQITTPLGMSGMSWVIRNGQIGQTTIPNYQYLEANALSAARFGLLTQRCGMWNGVQQIPAAFLAQATATTQEINPSYGFLWWLNNGASSGGHQQLFDGVRREGPYFPDAPPDTIAALGLNDQIIAVMPSLDLVIVRQGTQPLGAGSEAVSAEQNILLGKIARAFGYEGQPQPLAMSIEPQGSSVRFSFPTWFGRNYRVEQSADLAPDSWQNVFATPIAGNGLPFSMDRAMEPPRCFFRACADSPAP